MQKRHKECYAITLEAMSHGRPVRVIGINSKDLDEGEHRVFITIKDWNDPIFPGIWGALKTNSTTNDFSNIIADYLYGTKDKNNGCHTPTRLTDYFEEGTFIVVGTSINFK